MVQFRIAVNFSHITQILDDTKQQNGEREREREIEPLFAWLKCLLESNKNEEYIEMLFQNLGVCIIIIIEVCGSRRQHQRDTAEYQHYFNIIFGFVCACVCAYVCERAFVN